jgi:hypothetical protein
MINEEWKKTPAPVGHAIHFPIGSVAIPQRSRYVSSMTTTCRALLVLTLFSLPLLWAGSASACPNCKEAVAAGDSDDLSGTSEGSVGTLGAAYSISVLFMLGSFLSVLTGFSTAFYLLARSAAKAGSTAAVAAHDYAYSTSPSS